MEGSVEAPENREGSTTTYNEKETQPSEAGQEVETRTQDDKTGSVRDPYLVSWEGHDDTGCPRGLRKLTKWSITLIISAGAFNTTCASSIYTSTYEQIERDLNCSHELAIAGLSLYVMGLGIGPMFLAPLSEFYGRRPIYITSFACYILSLIPCAAANNITTLLVGRLLGGVAGSAFLSVAGGTVGDMFEKGELGLPMMVFTASPISGPAIGPLIGGFINQYTNWRWTWYVMIIWSVIQWALLCIVPETYNPVLLQRKAATIRRETGDDRYYAPYDRREDGILKTVLISCKRPFQLLAFEPMLLALCTFTALLLGILYIFFQAFAIIFRGTYGFTLSQLGLSFLGLFMGLTLGVLTDPLWRRAYDRLVERRDGQSIPEFRLVPGILGGVLVPIGIFWFGYTTYPSVHWIVPIIGSAVFGTGMLLVYSSVFAFLVDCYPLYAASAMAANSFTRSCFAAGFPLFSTQMYHTLGNQNATLILALLAVVMAPFPYIFFKHGEKLRKYSRYARS
ncbi:hypothetical protein DRE_04321 [Drechslerella stenobrocha 248]|uniref:Major facilitator superfamily (MFS) profile domain-containing protein n=1 Tax=Drechslerella stenobrocha 248 TaxID=1043628 RepID=W7I254_9PEZI|nr:hypothetical protein DRE_04321 [Drechslerella stenobrocha 248]